jgi:RNA polymerase sigma-70 factor, ECF subfamily
MRSHWRAVNGFPILGEMAGEHSFDDLLDGARRGDADALGELYRRCQPGVLRFLTAQAGESGHDLASETWLDVAAGLPRFSGDEIGFRRWLFTIARRRLIDARRRDRRRPTRPDDPALLDRPDRTADTEGQAIGGIESQAALRRIASLPPDQAEVVLLRVLGGLSAEDVAHIVGKSPANVRVIQHRALTRLAAQLEGVTR